MNSPSFISSPHNANDLHTSKPVDMTAGDASRKSGWFELAYLELGKINTIFSLD